MKARNLLAGSVFWLGAMGIALGFGDETGVRRVKLPLEGSPIDRESQSELAAKSSMTGNGVPANGQTESALVRINRAPGLHMSGRMSHLARTTPDSMEGNQSQIAGRASKNVRPLQQNGVAPIPYRGAPEGSGAFQRRDTTNSAKQRGMIVPHAPSVQRAPINAAVPN